MEETEMLQVHRKRGHPGLAAKEHIFGILSADGPDDLLPGN